MNSMLKKRTEEWMRLERKTAEQQKEAEEFYERNLLSLIEKDYQRRNRNKLIEKVEYLVMSVGTSYEPLVLNIGLLRPKRILFLYTQKSESTLSKVVRHCNLDVEQYQKELVDESNPLTIYREIKESYLNWRKPQRIYIDFTGGTKAMAAAAAMAGALIDVQLVYVGSEDYLPEFRKPNPGSEVLLFIDNPIMIFGDLEIGKAMTLFEQCNYDGAKEKLSKLRNTVPEPEIRQQLEFAWELAQVYEKWDALDFQPAYEWMQKLTCSMVRDRRTHPTFLMMDFLPRFNEQQNLLEELSRIPNCIKDHRQMEMLQNKDLMTALMFTLLEDSRIREKQNKLDTATLLLYRLLEMIGQRRLAEYNLYASHMDYAALSWEKVKEDGPKNFNELKERTNSIRQQLFGSRFNHYLQEQVSLLDGYTLLLALGDEISLLKNGRHIDFLKRMRAMVYLRNNSIFAHGLGPVDRTDYIRFRDFVMEILMKYCGLEKINFEKCRQNICWISPLHSTYYGNLGM